MKKLLWLCAAAMLVPAMAFANGGVDLSWGDCAPDAGSHQPARSFNCTGTANTTHNLLLYFKPNRDLPNFVGIRMDIDLQTDVNAPLPPFYHYEVGGCQRPGAPTPAGVTMTDAIVAGSACEGFNDPWAVGTEGFEGIATYIFDDDRPGNGHFVLGVAHSTSFSLIAKQNYYGAQLSFNNRNRGICAGCGTPAVIKFNSATLESNDGTEAQEIAFTAGKGGDCVTLNNGSAPRCVDPTPTRNSTWGQVKSLYR